jgi:hypothetical protein
MMFA